MLVALGAAGNAGAVRAIELRPGEDAQAKLSGAVTFGAGVRTEDPRPENYGSLAGSRVGRSGGLTSANSGLGLLIDKAS